MKFSPETTDTEIEKYINFLAKKIRKPNNSPDPTSMQMMYDRMISKIYEYNLEHGYPETDPFPSILYEILRLIPKDDLYNEVAHIFSKYIPHKETTK